jgi:cyclic pyranopterin monophosphate synthase
VNDPRRLTHVDERGRIRMVDIGAKAESERRAVAEATVRMAPETALALSAGAIAKGDVIAAARIAGIQAAKRTGELIPLAHPLPLAFADIEAEVDPPAGAVTLRAVASTVARTGVEMEAMTACAVAALTVYDMVKGVQRGVAIERIELVSKTGGKADWRRDAGAG